MLSPLFGLLILAVPQGPDTPGPHDVGIRDLSVQDQRFGQGSIASRIYYPATSAGMNTAADPSGGPYPLVNMMHGWLGSADGLDSLSIHIASWGFVVISTDTHRGFFPDTADYARDSRSLLWWVEDEAQDFQSWLSGMVAPGTEWASTGHSMGGGTLGELIGIEPRVRTIIGMQAAANGAGEMPVENFDGQCYWIAGSVDNIVRPNTVRSWFERANRNRHNVYFLVNGMGHLGPIENPPNNEPLPGAEQARQHRLLLGGILRYEMKGEEDLGKEVFSMQTLGDPTDRECANFAPVVWGAPDTPGSTQLALGTAARMFGGVALAWSPTPAQRQTPYGLLGLDPLQTVRIFAGTGGASGVVEPLPFDASAFTGQTLYVTAAALGGGRSPQLGNTVTIAVP